MFMFTHDCSACDRTQLIFPSMITGATRTDAGTQVTFECWCGAPQTALRSAAKGENREMVAA
ncbi:hypothetical protein [Nocardioides sp. REDSEA-S30_B4]|jgi:hypothetical protein|uniref:hypothetical protein n=1 Tax=Nocardioides sp. REDSEA-S30_B4 TaxID=1811552 RepID=UPI000A7490C5|nr:hypothetical protein [Nocardioides sp. REDSEA-S30_B4]